MSEEIEQAIRKSHCSRKGEEHRCAGSCKITPKGLELECHICGNDTNKSIYFDKDLLRRAQQICNAIGVELNEFKEEKQMKILREVLKDYCPGCDRTHILVKDHIGCECGYMYSYYSGWQRPLNPTV
jgi:hypothetical protein